MLTILPPPPTSSQFTAAKASAIPHEMPTWRTMMVDARPYVPGRALPRQVLARLDRWDVIGAAWKSPPTRPAWSPDSIAGMFVADIGQMLYWERIGDSRT
jgi:hypothetical protein